MQSDYQLIEKSIKYLEENFRAQPTLTEIAEASGLSPFHFQKLFKRWAGISPKKFVQFLTVEYIKSKLESDKVLDSAFDAGLSSSSRIHELFFNIEAVSPTEYKTLGKNLTIYYGFHESPFGECLIAVTQKGICALYFDKTRTAALIDLKSIWENARLIEDEKKTEEYYKKIFGKNKSKATINIFLKGTNFQVQVWKALLRTQRGELTTYEDIAKQIKHPTALRAVGSAVGRNNISFLIPCHRVINKIGVIGNYRWGTERKKAMIVWEAGQPSANIR